MKREGAVPVIALGAATPVGRNAWASAAAVRAGLGAYAQHPYMIDSAGQPMRVARAPWLDIGLSGVERLEALLLPAIDEALAPLDGGGGSLRLALALALPAPRPGLPDALAETLRLRVQRRYPGRFSALVCFPVGHAAGLVALDAARASLLKGSIDACVVAGVDSYLDRDTLEWLEANDQLHGAGPLNNAWGFIPGEAGGALLLASEASVARLRLKPLGRVVGTGVGLEKNRIKTETVCIGEGLTQAFRQAFESLPDGMRVSDVYCDMNGEPYRADEYGFACMRTGPAFEDASAFVAPADCWGDVAAATGPLCVGLSLIAARKAYAKGKLACVWASSESGERAAALLAPQLEET